MSKVAVFATVATFGFIATAAACSGRHDDGYRSPQEAVGASPSATALAADGYTETPWMQVQRHVAFVPTGRLDCWRRVVTYVAVGVMQPVETADGSMSSGGRYETGPHGTAAAAVAEFLAHDGTFR